MNKLNKILPMKTLPEEYVVVSKEDNNEVEIALYGDKDINGIRNGWKVIIKNKEGEYDSWSRRWGSILPKHKHLPVFTYNEWKKLFYKTEEMKEEFVLPKEWYVQLTEENVEIVKTWFKKVASHSMRVYSVGAYYGMNCGNGDAWSEDALPNGKIIITFEQFQKYVLSKTTPTVTKLSFGNLEFTIFKAKEYAECKEGAISKQEIQAIVDWFDKDFELLGHKMKIKNEGKWFISFGCANGTLSEAKAILKAFN